jgi:hypothetical protein
MRRPLLLVPSLLLISMPVFGQSLKRFTDSPGLAGGGSATAARSTNHYSSRAKGTNPDLPCPSSRICR